MNTSVPATPASVDYAHWSRMARWATSQAAALSLGIDPDHINLDDLDASPLAPNDRIALKKRLNVVTNHIQTGRIGHHVEPGEFLSWAASNGIDCSESLCEAVRRNGAEISDWRHQNTSLISEREIDRKKIGKLEAQLEALQSGACHDRTREPDSARALNPKVERSYQKDHLRFGIRNGLSARAPDRRHQEDCRPNADVWDFARRADGA